MGLMAGACVQGSPQKLAGQQAHLYAGLYIYSSLSGR